MLENLEPARKVNAPKNFQPGLEFDGNEGQATTELSHPTLTTFFPSGVTVLTNTKLLALLARHSGNVGMGCG